MEELQRNVRRVLLEARRQLETLEAASTNSSLDPAASSDIHAAFRGNLAALDRDIAGMRSLLTREPQAKRDVWRARLRDLEEQLAELRYADSRVAGRFRQIAADVSVREELFQRRAGARCGEAGGGGGGDAIIGIGNVGADEAAGAAAEGRVLNGAQVGVSGILSSGTSALEQLVNQRVRLKGARRKVMDVMNTMGAGRRLIAQIERRDRRDTVLVYSLMAGILVLLGIAVLFKHHRKAQHG